MKLINKKSKFYLPMIVLVFFAYCGVGLFLNTIKINIFYDPLGLLSTFHVWMGESIFITLSIFGIALFPVYLFGFIVFVKKDKNRSLVFEKKNMAVEWIGVIITIIYIIKFIFLKLKVAPNYLVIMEKFGLSFPKILIMMMEGWIPFFFAFISFGLLILLLLPKKQEKLPLKVRFLILFTSFYLIFITNGMIQIILLHPIQELIPKL